MMANNMNKMLSVALTLVLIVFSSQIPNGAQTPDATTAADSGSPTGSAPQTASELQALVAPIALYPDSLVAQILTASTFPDEVAIANYWIGQNKSLTGSALMQAVDKQSWDPSVKALIRTERYLSMTPERFRKQLLKLSLQRHKKRRWRKDPALMKFLAQL